MSNNCRVNLRDIRVGQTYWWRENLKEFVRVRITKRGLDDIGYTWVVKNYLMSPMKVMSSQELMKSMFISGYVTSAGYHMGILKGYKAMQAVDKGE